MSAEDDYVRDQLGDLAGDDPDEDRLMTDAGGRPKLDHLGRALQVWAICQKRADAKSPTVAQAALAFCETPERVRQAVATVYFMFLAGDGLEATLEQEGV